MADNALETYLKKEDAAFAWQASKPKESADFQVTQLDVTSQEWRGIPWKHNMFVVRPKLVRNPDIAFLLIAGSEAPQSHLQTLKTVAAQGGAIAALISEVPNQPLFEGKSEDALIAYTFDQFLRTGDETWPLLFPMAKSAVRAADALQQFASSEWKQTVSRFVLSGASKRGWTTYLTASVDPRVVGIVPRVFDMLNMKVQTEWARKVYGHQSERIDDYSDANLIDRIDEPRAVQLRKWIDPYFVRNRFTMPKLLLLGTNDPYWTVDSMRHYWADLPGLKLVYQTPNAGHGLGDAMEADNTTAAFFEMVADRQSLPNFEWTVLMGKTNAEIEIKADQVFKAARLWMATSADRDLRNSHWEAHPVKKGKKAGTAGVSIVVPGTGYRAALMEAEFVSPKGKEYKLSTEATVVPEL